MLAGTGNPGDTEIREPEFFKSFLRDKRFRFNILTQLDREWVREPSQSLVKKSPSWNLNKDLES